jgi:hypothetical protein
MLPRMRHQTARIQQSLQALRSKWEMRNRSLDQHAAARRTTNLRSSNLRRPTTCSAI